MSAVESDAEVVAGLDFTPRCEAYSSADAASRCTRAATWMFACPTPGCMTGGSVCDAHKAMHFHQERYCIRCRVRGPMRDIMVWIPL